MRKLCYALTALLLTAPALGGVTVSCVAVANDVTVSYVASDDANLPRAFGIDVTVDGDGTITGLTDLSDDYWVHPGTIVITDGNVSSEGSPEAPSSDPGAKPGIGSNGITLEMGSLYAAGDPCHPNEPPLSGDLVSLKIGGSGTVHVTISGNAARGNVVLETTAEADVNYTSGCDVVFDCFPAGPDYAGWVALGKPSCWCNAWGPRQCYGDADGLKGGNSKTGYYYVGSSDLTVLAAGWKVPEPPKGSGIKGRLSGIVPLVCADFAHDKGGNSKTGYYYLGSTDLTVLAAHWKIPQPPKGSGVATDCP
jgi:hypothetical protein